MRHLRQVSANVTRELNLEHLVDITDWKDGMARPRYPCQGCVGGMQGSAEVVQVGGVVREYIEVSEGTGTNMGLRRLPRGNEGLWKGMWGEQNPPPRQGQWEATLESRSLAFVQMRSAIYGSPRGSCKGGIHHAGEPPLASTDVRVACAVTR